MSRPVVKLADFLAHFAKAGAEAAHACAERSKDYLMDLFERREHGLVPKTVRVNAAGRAVDVPLLSIAQTPATRFDTMQMGFSASVDVTRDGETTVSNHCRLLKKSVEVDVQMTFKAADPPEGLELVRDRLNRDLSDALGKIVPAVPLEPSEPVKE